MPTYGCRAAGSLSRHCAAQQLCRAGDRVFLCALRALQCLRDVCPDLRRLSAAPDLAPHDGLRLLGLREDLAAAEQLACGGAHGSVRGGPRTRRLRQRLLLRGELPPLVMEAPLHAPQGHSALLGLACKAAVHGRQRLEGGLEAGDLTAQVPRRLGIFAVAGLEGDLGLAAQGSHVPCERAGALGEPLLPLGEAQVPLHDLPDLPQLGVALVPLVAVNAACCCRHGQWSGGATLELAELVAGLLQFPTLARQHPALRRFCLLKGLLCPRTLGAVGTPHRSLCCLRLCEQVEVGTGDI
mmetsp:Transcript_86677/g.240359  ORF Transcript_86677/g.240359 Transcript_86677/m.240359 type:complete len:297 (+) Transcript_86677:65-955(+)